MRFAARCATHEARQRGKKIFFAFLCVLDHFESIETHFFFENFREREARNAHERSERDASAKPEEAKRPSSPAGLAGRSAERACKLVFFFRYLSRETGLYYNSFNMSTLQYILSLILTYLDNELI